MKLLLGLLVSVLAVSLTVALPARNPDDDAEIVVVPLEKQGGRRPVDVDPDFKDFHGVIEADSYPFLSLAPLNPFRWNLGFFDSFEDVLRRFQDQITKEFSSIPEPEDCNDPARCNATSTVKIVGNHKVVVNETVYNKTGEHGNSIHKVTLISVRPLNSEEQPEDGAVLPEKPADVNTASEDDKGSPEILDTNTKDNEVLGNIDSKESTELIEHEGNLTHKMTDLEQDSIYKKRVESVEQERQEQKLEQELEQEQEQDQEQQSQQDTLKEGYSDEVQQAGEQGPVKQKPESFDGEFSDEFDVSNFAGTENYPQEWEPFGNELHPQQEQFNNDIDLYETIPIDLSNDIAVNQILADRGTPLNPDAEVLPAGDLLKRHIEQPLVSGEFAQRAPSRFAPSQSLTANKLQPIK